MSRRTWLVAVLADADGFLALERTVVHSTGAITQSGTIWGRTS